MPPLDRHLLPTLALAAGLALGAQARDVATDSVNTFAPAAEAPKPAQVLREVSVEGVKVSPENGSAAAGYAADTASLGPLGKVRVQDVPFSLNVTSGALVENSGAHSLADALKTNPTVAATQLPRTWVSIPRASIRGFEPIYLRDGLYMHTLVPPAVENVERIEVLNGLSGFLYGFGSLGGSINFVSRQPVSSPLADLSVGSYGGGISYAQADVGGPLGDSASPLSYRLDIYKEGGDNYIQDGSQERTLYSGIVDYKPFAGALAKVGVYHQDYVNRGLQTTFIVTPSKGISVPKAFDPSILYGQPWTSVKGTQDMYDVGFQLKPIEAVGLRAAYRYNHVYRKYAGVYSTLVDNKGDYTQTIADFAPQDYDMFAGYALVDADFSVGPVGNAVTAGYSGYSYLQKTNATSRIYVAVADTFNVSTPSYIQSLDTAAPLAENSHSKQVTHSFVLGDRLSLGSRFEALLGVNHTVYSNKVSRVDNGTVSTSYEQDRNTPTATLVFKPIRPVSTYVSYMEGISAGGTAPSTAANAGQMLSPSASTQWEAGVKAEVAGSFDLALAAFRIDKINEYVDPADTVYKQDGRQIHQGVELTAVGRLWSRLSLGGGFTVLDARVRRARSNTAIEGKTPVNVPDKQVRGFMEYSVPHVDGLVLTAGGNFYGRRPVDAKNLAFTQSASTYDAGIRYSSRVRGRDATLTLNVLNVLDTWYWAGYLDGCGLMQGDPRTVSLSAKVSL